LDKNIFYPRLIAPQKFFIFLENLLVPNIVVSAVGVDATKCWSVYKWYARWLSWAGVFPSPVVRLFGDECTINDSKARKELNYQSTFGLEEGLEEMRLQHLSEKINNKSQ